jgi:hypothetical protein
MGTGGPYRWCLTWNLWIVLIGVAAALACTGHPAAHDMAHPALCIDTNTPAALTDGAPLLVASGGPLRLPPRRLAPVVPPATATAHLAVGLGCWPPLRSGMPERTCTSVPHDFLPVLTR